MHHDAHTQTTIALSPCEAKLYALSSSTAETMGVLQFLRDYGVKSGSHVTVATDSNAGKSMASRISVNRTTRHLQLCDLRMQDLAAASVVRLCKVPMKDDLARLHSKLLFVDRARPVWELHCVRSSVVHCRIHVVTTRHHFMQSSTQHSSCVLAMPLTTTTRSVWVRSTTLAMLLHSLWSLTSFATARASHCRPQPHVAPLRRTMCPTLSPSITSSSRELYYLLCYEARPTCASVPRPTGTRTSRPAGTTRRPPAGILAWRWRPPGSMCRTEKPS